MKTIFFAEIIKADHHFSETFYFIKRGEAQSTPPDPPPAPLAFARGFSGQYKFLLFGPPD